jgi:predicted nucleic acid-binding protein
VGVRFAVEGTSLGIALSGRGRSSDSLYHPTILEELFDVLSYDRFQSRLHQLGINPAELIGYAMNLATIFEVPASDPIVLADPEDDVFLWCAEAADVAYVVSGDHHLLDLRSHAGIHTITVHDFLTREFPDEAG